MKKIALFALVALAHLVVVLTLNFVSGQARQAVPERAEVFKLVDVNFKEPEKIEPPPKDIPEPSQVALQDATSEAIVVTEDQVPLNSSSAALEEDYLPMHKISQVPQINESLVRKNLRYPEIARRSEKEGLVYLELFIDREGRVRKISVLKEEPSGLGFAEAAVQAFSDFVCTPAKANGQAVSVRYRYPIRFSLR